MRRSPLPNEFRQTIPSGAGYSNLIRTLAEEQLNTVCEEAKCPNRTGCYGRGALAFQILGKICTRHCAFCGETSGSPAPLDQAEPARVVEAAKKLKLRHAVITAPARDDIADGGAGVFAETVRLFKKELPEVTVELLISDLGGNEPALIKILENAPDVLNHNVETVRRLTPKVRSKATYDGSLALLKCSSVHAGEKKLPIRIKSGLMTGLGETMEEIFGTLEDLHKAGVRTVTVGQYLRPSSRNLPVEKFYTADEFRAIRQAAESIGFERTAAAPLVRSSYHADELL